MKAWHQSAIVKLKVSNLGDIIQSMCYVTYMVLNTGNVLHIQTYSVQSILKESERFKLHTSLVRNTLV